MEKEFEESIAKLLNYSFNPIQWNYDSLTGIEKSLVTKEEFEKIKKKYGPK
jgi:hypothetical protein